MPHEWGEPPVEETITVACIMDCPTITVHAGKWYKALIDSGAAISLLRYSAYKNIEGCHKTPIQPMTAKLTTADGSPMSALGMTALHLIIAKFKYKVYTEKTFWFEMNIYAHRHYFYNSFKLHMHDQ